MFPPSDPTITDVEPRDPTPTVFTDENIEGLSHEQLCHITVGLVRAMKSVTEQLIAQGKVIAALQEKAQNL